MLLVELEVRVVAGIALLAAPHLQRRLGIAEEGDRRPRAAARGDAVRLIRGQRLVTARLGHQGVELRLAWHVVAVKEDGRGRRHEVRVGDEIFEIVLGEHLFDARAEPPVAAILAGGGRPFVARPVGALGQPDAARGGAEVPLVRLDRGAELHADRFVAREERQVAVRRRAGDDLDVAAALQLGERPGYVAADAPVELPHALVELLPEPRELDDVVVPLTHEVRAAVDARAAYVLVVERTRARRAARRARARC